MRMPRLTSAILPVLTWSAWLAVSSPGFAQTIAPAQNAPRQQSPSTSGAAVEGIGTVLRDTVQDFSRLGTIDNLKWIGIGGMMAAFSRPFDQPLSNTLSSAAALDGPFDAGQTVGGARLQLAGALATYGIGRITASPRVTAVGSDLLQAQIVAQALTAGIKLVAQRTRPDGTQYSFPSGHTSVAFASATVLQRHFGWKTGAAAYGVAAYVAASRVQERRHFLSDVAFGATIGILAGRTVTIGVGEQRFAVAPMAAPGGGGVAFTWLDPH